MISQFSLSLHRCSLVFQTSSLFSGRSIQYVSKQVCFNPLKPTRPGNLSIFARNYCRNIEKNRLGIRNNTVNNINNSSKNSLKNIHNGCNRTTATRLSNFNFRDRLQLITRRAFKEGEKKGIKNEWEEIMKLSLTQRLKVIIKKYWYVAIPLHFVNCSLWLATLYIFCRLGFDGSKIIEFIKPYVLLSPLPPIVKDIFIKDTGNLGHVAVALLLYKIFTPARYATTVFISFYTIRFLLQRGIIVKSANQQFKQLTYASQANAKNIQKRLDKLKNKIKKSRNERQK